jgi:hypothetical protein
MNKNFDKNRYFIFFETYSQKLFVPLLLFFKIMMPKTENFHQHYKSMPINTKLHPGCVLQPKTKRPSPCGYQPFGVMKYLAFAGAGSRPVQW